jgi:hypothetical protein
MAKRPRTRPPDPACLHCRPAGIEWTAAVRLEGTGGMKPPGVQRVEHRVRHHDGPGRPSSKALVRQEAERRVAASTASPLLKTFSSDLSDWLRETYPGLSQMTPRGVENVVRDIWQRWQPNI